MTTEQMERVERPLSEVDDIATRLQDPSRGSNIGSDGLMARLRELVSQVWEDPGWRLAIILTIASVVVTNLIVMARPKPRSREDVILDRSREALERSRETLDEVARKLAEALDR
jgi:hypothetical protein